MYRPKEEERVLVCLDKGERVVGKLKHVQRAMAMALVELPSGHMMRCPLHKLRALRKPMPTPAEAPPIPVTMQEAQVAVEEVYHHIDTTRLPLFKRFLKKMRLTH